MRNRILLNSSSLAHGVAPSVEEGVGVGAAAGGAHRVQALHGQRDRRQVGSCKGRCLYDSLKLLSIIEPPPFSHIPEKLSGLNK